MSRPISLARAVLVVVAVLLSSSHLFSQAISVGVSLSDYNGFSVSCNGSEDGSINVTVSGGTAPYSFLWNTTNGSVAADGATVEDLTDLKAGTYTVIVNDSLGAADTVMVTLLSPSEMQMDGMMVELPSGQYYGCAACADGNGMMVVSGSVPPYSFTWPAAITHIDTDTSTSVSNFAPNTQYAFTVTDANGCSVEDDMQTPSYNAAAPLELFGTLSSFSGGHQVSIYGGSNGWIHLQVVGGTSPYTYGWSNGATTPDISNLSVGTYTVVVTDAAQQQAQKSFTLNGPANPLSATLGVSNPNCAGVSSGQLTTSVSGATPPYTYLWSTADGSPNVNGATSASINQLEPGIYSVSIKDANNDSLIVSDTIVAPIEIQTSIVPSVNEQGYHLLCAKGSSVVLDLSVLGGTAPYSYQWDNGKFTQDITVTQPGTYMVQVKDALNCLRYDSLLVVAPEDVEIDAQWHTYPNGKLFSCDTCNDAQLTVNFTGGVPPYIITLSSAWQTMMGPNFSGIYADTSYTLHFEDALGCVREMSGAEALVIPRDGFNSLGVSAQFSQYPGGYNISTSGGSDGWINLNIYGEMSQPTVIWNDGAVGKYRDGLSAGTYGATISDNAGQSITQSWTLTEPQSGISLMLQVSSANCTGNGNLMVMVNGGTPPYSFVWSNMYGQIAAAMWSNLSVQGDGQYDVMVVDANSDTAYSSIYYQSPHISMNATSPYVIGTYNTGCANGDGTIEMEVFGGTPPYVFTLDNYKGNRMMDTVMTTTHSIGGLNAGWYRATITGVNGCTVDADITLTAPPKPEFDAQWQTYPNGKLFSCDTCNDAQVTLNLTGGAQPYTVTLSSSMGSQTGSVFTGIYADTSYTLTMEDALGCVRTETLVIPREGFSSLGVSAQLSQYPGGYNVSTHGGNDGWINLNIYGEMSQPTVVWNDGMIGRNRNGLSAGTYEATISDNAGQSITRSYELIQPQSGPSVMLSGKYSNCQGGGNINAMVNGGTPPYSYRWYGPYGQLAEQWSNIWANQPGDYTLWVKDANNDSTEANIPMYPAPSLWVEVNSPMLHGTANAGCNIPDGSIIVNFHGGQPPYQVSLKDLAYGNKDNSPMGPAANTTSSAAGSGKYFSTNDSILVIDSLRAGQYHVLVTDMGMCGGQGRDIELRSPPPISVKVVPTPQPNGYYLSCDTCHDGTAELQVTGANGSLQYAWAQVPEEYVDQRLEGASIFKRLDGKDVDPTELFSGNVPFVIGSSAQQTNLSPEVMYAGFAMDELGCMSGEGFMLEKPKDNGGGSDPDWKLNGNSGLNPMGLQRWLGTNDNTDFVMKANNQPQLRLGADGITEVVQGLKMSALPEHVPDTLLPSPRILLLQPDGTVTASPAMGGEGFFPWEPPRGPMCITAVGGSYVEYWKYEPNKIYIRCPQVNVGLGTNDPLAKLDVRGSGHFSGNVAVGTHSPLAALDVRNGNILVGYRTAVGSPSANAMLDVRASNNAAAFTFETLDMDGLSSFRVRNNGKVIVGNGAFSEPTIGVSSLFFGNESYNISAKQGVGIGIGAYNDPDHFALYVPESSFDVKIPSRLQVGAETVTGGPHTDHRLSVDGKIVAKEFVVTTDINYWSDYVFDADYHLRPLSEVSAFIQENGHLPDVPSAEEVSCEGLDLGRMDALLLRKIEELTLYIIELEKRLNEKR